MEGLTKENTWNAIEVKYPIAFNHFMEWLTKYKEEVNWHVLFNDAVIKADPKSWEKSCTEAPKFHELPIEMQLGIMMRYTSDTWGLTNRQAFNAIVTEMHRGMDEQFSYIDKNLNNGED